MIVQVLIVLIALFLWRFKFQDGHIYGYRKDSKFMIIMCVILILQAGLRHENCGADTYAYKLFWKSYYKEPWSFIISEIQSNSLFDPGFFVFMKVSQYIFPSYQLFLLLSAMFFSVALCNFVYKLIDRNFDIVWFVLIYECLFYSTLAECTTRQGYAIALCFFSYKFIEQRKLLPFIATICLASMFHGSALLFLPFYFLHGTKKMGLVIGVAIMIVPILFSMRNSFVSFAVDVIGNEKYYDYKEATGNAAYSFAFFYILVFSLGVIFRKTYIKYKKEAPDMLMAMTLGLALLPMLFVSGTLMRVVQYYSVFMIIFVPTLNNCIIKYKKQYRFIFIILFFVFLMKIVATNHPYAFFWQDMPTIEQQERSRG